MKYKLFVVFLIVLLVISCALPIFAHSGRTDSNGGHYGDGGYHYHHGYPAHDHYDMDGDGTKDCPYRFDDATNHKSQDSSASHVVLDTSQISVKEVIMDVFILLIILAISCYIIPLPIVLVYSLFRLIFRLIKHPKSQKTINKLSVIGCVAICIPLLFACVGPICIKIILSDPNLVVAIAILLVLSILVIVAINHIRDASEDKIREEIYAEYEKTIKELESMIEKSKLQ